MVNISKNVVIQQQTQQASLAKVNTTGKKPTVVVPGQVDSVAGGGGRKGLGGLLEASLTAPMVKDCKTDFESFTAALDFAKKHTYDAIGKTFKHCNSVCIVTGIERSPDAQGPVTGIAFKVFDTMGGAFSVDKVLNF